MEGRGLRYFIGFVVVVGLLIFLIALITGGGDNSKNVPNQPKALSSYADEDSQVSMLIDGRTNAPQDHRQVLITVDANHIDFQVRRGYNGDLVNDQSFPNTRESYKNLLLSLEHADFTKGDLKHATTDERGYCPLGKRYVFELQSQSNTIERFWATSCGKPKTFLGDFDTTLTLFQNQVPNYGDLTNNVEL